MGMSTSRTVRQTRTGRNGKTAVGANTGRLANGLAIIGYPVNLTHAVDPEHPTRGRCGVGPPWESTLQRTAYPDEVTCAPCRRILDAEVVTPPDTA